LISLSVGALAVNCFIDGGAGAVVDPGDESQKIIARLEAESVKLRFIILTHGHYDHLQALPELFAYSVKQGSPAVIAVHEADKCFLGGGARVFHRRTFGAASGGDTSFVDDRWQDLPEPSCLLADGDNICGFTVLHVPGHTAGSVAFYNEKDGVLLSGDTLFRYGLGRTDLPESEPAKLKSSIKRLFSLPPDTKVFPGHGPATTIAGEAAAMDTLF
jgi:glyoxylase-like metal-dependent hydrolase (beta-lactamase superfamily II)